MYNWSHIKTKIKSGDVNFIRSDYYQHKYDDNKVKILQKYNTYEDYIKVVLFKLKYKRNSHGKIVSDSNDMTDKILLILNKYPYNIVKDIKHYILFSLKPLDIDKIRKILLNLLIDYEFVFFINNNTKKSIKKLWHCHVFIKLGTLKK
jgi:hypothetical protein